MSRKTSQKTSFEPKLQNRWICYIEDDKGNQLIPSYLIKTVYRPDFFRNSSNKKAGKNTLSHLTGESLDLLAYDPIKPSASKLFTNLLDSQQVFRVRLDFLGSVGELIEEWIYDGCKIESLSFSRLDWETKNEPAMVTATISILSAKIL